MRTLVLLLVPNDELYFSWPAIRALIRSRPEREIHLLILRSAEEMLPPHGDLRVHCVESAEAAGRHLKGTEFGEIFNLSFSRESSEIAAELAGAQTRIAGYSRNSDGTLAIPDDTSAYVYAQTGSARSNRYHWTEVSAAVLGVELTDDDLFVDQFSPGTSLVLAVDDFGLRSKWKGPVKLFSRGEALTYATMEEILRGAALLISSGGPEVALASMMSVPVLFLSADGAVSFWEKGPWFPGSRVLPASTDQDASSEIVFRHALGLIQQHAPVGPCWLRATEGKTYLPHGIRDDRFSWDLIQALYTSKDYPAAPDNATAVAFQRLLEIAELAVQILDHWDQDRDQAARKLAVVDEMLEQVMTLAPQVSPVVRWFQTERVRIAPAAELDVLTRTRQLFSDLFLIASVYHPHEGDAEVRTTAARLCRSCGPAFREWDMAVAVADFQSLLTSIQELARRSSGLGDRPWSEILNNLTTSFDRHDFVDVADQVEFIIAPDL